MLIVNIHASMMTIMKTMDACVIYNLYLLTIFTDQYQRFKTFVIG